jgi:hypothetical protein
MPITPYNSYMPKHEQITEGHKTCGYCGINKPSTEFFTIDKRGKAALFPHCKPCCSAIARNKRVADPVATQVRDKKYHLRYGYGLTRPQYDSLLEKQKGLCAVCDAPLDPAYVDHCHTSGAVRGLLCKHCNFGIGHFKEDVFIIENAIQYLLNKRLIR